MLTYRMSSVIILVLVVTMPHLLAQARPHDDHSDGGNNSTQATQRLMKEFKDFHKSDSYEHGVFTVELVDNNIYIWHVKLFVNDPKNPLHGDLKELKRKGGQDHVLIELRYSDDYPFKPPFVRVVSPNLTPYVKYGGALCLKILTEDGWNSAYTIEPLILSISFGLINHCRVETTSSEPYSYEDAKMEFDYLLLVHMFGGKWYD